METILLVEPRKSLVLLYTALLRERYRVVTAVNASEALARLWMERPAAILIGQSQPGKDGMELCKELAENARDLHPALIVYGRPSRARQAELKRLDRDEAQQRWRFDELLRREPAPAEVEILLQAALRHRRAKLQREGDARAAPAESLFRAPRISTARRTVAEEAQMTTWRDLFRRQLSLRTIRLLLAKQIHLFPRRWRDASAQQAAAG